jgi:hypothetical protein
VILPSNPVWLFTALLQAVVGPHDVDGEQRQQIAETLRRLRPALALAAAETSQRFDAICSAQFANAASDLSCQMRVLGPVTGSAQKKLAMLSEAAGLAAPKLSAQQLSVEEARGLLDGLAALADGLGQQR